MWIILSKIQMVDLRESLINATPQSTNGNNVKLILSACPCLRRRFPMLSDPFQTFCEVCRVLIGIPLNEHILSSEVTLDFRTKRIKISDDSIWSYRTESIVAIFGKIKESICTPVGADDEDSVANDSFQRMVVDRLIEDQNGVWRGGFSWMEKS